MIGAVNSFLSNHPSDPMKRPIHLLPLIDLAPRAGFAIAFIN